VKHALFAALLVALGFSVGAEESAPAQAPAAAAQPAPALEEAPLRHGPLLVARVAGTINPASADFLTSAIREAEETHAALLLIELDTPGGDLASTQEIVRAMLEAKAPIAVYVPRGAWAASAGTFITLAAHVAAMAPGSSIGAAHPISVGGNNQRGPQGEDSEEKAPPIDIGLEKAENFTASFIESIAKERGRNAEWAAKAVRESVAIAADEAAKQNVVDLVAADREALLAAIDGRVVKLGAGSLRLAVKDAAARELEMGLLARFLHAIADPTFAFLFMFAGAALIWLELNTPGVGVPGVLGAACLIVAAVSFQLVPFSWLGLGLFVGGVVLVGAELFVSSYGLLLAAGIVCMLLGGSMIFDRPEVSDLDLPFWQVVVPAVGAFGVFGVFATFMVARAHRRPSKLGGEGELIGMRGVASTALAPSGTVALRGELWTADADGRIEKGEAIEVVSIEGMRLRVKRARPRS
jgi:membrane-bound serine protease (ClpP class)